METDDSYFEEEDNKKEKKKINRKIALIFIGFLLTFSLIFVLMPVLFLDVLIEDPLCANEIIERNNNTDKEYDYVIFRRDCGATTGYSYHISILKHKQKLKNKPGNIYINDILFTAIWTSTNSLLIKDNTRNAYKIEEIYKGIKIIYE